MESAQRELMRVLLDALRSRGLLSAAAYLNAADLIHSTADIPPFFQCPARLTKEAGPCEYS